MKAFLKENYIKILVLLLAGLLFILWARVYYAHMRDDSFKSNLATNEDRVRCLEHYGWQVDPHVVEEHDVTIPAVLDDIYTEYNELQKPCGFDLNPYRGKKVMRYTYRVLNFPIQYDEPVFANILLYEDRLIGGDVMSTDLRGFMLPLDPAKHYS